MTNIEIVDGIPLIKKLNNQAINEMYETTVERASSDNCIFMVYKDEKYMYFPYLGVVEEYNKRKNNE